jgi:hypothetical protein
MMSLSVSIALLNRVVNDQQDVLDLGWVEPCLPADGNGETRRHARGGYSRHQCQQSLWRGQRANRAIGSSLPGTGAGGRGAAGPPDGPNVAAMLAVFEPIPPKPFQVEIYRCISWRPTIEKLKFTRRCYVVICSKSSGCQGLLTVCHISDRPLLRDVSA